MSWVVSSIGDFFRHRRRALAVTGGLAGGAYLVGKYALGKLRDTQQRLVAERRDKENLRRRFSQNQDDCTFTALALLPTLADQLFAALNVEDITATLQRKKTRASSAPAPEPAPEPAPTPSAEPTGDQDEMPHADANGAKPVANGTHRVPQGTGEEEQSEEQYQTEMTDSTQTIKGHPCAAQTEPSSLNQEPDGKDEGTREQQEEQASSDATKEAGVSDSTSDGGEQVAPPGTAPTVASHVSKEHPTAPPELQTDPEAKPALPEPESSSPTTASTTNEDEPSTGAPGPTERSDPGSPGRVADRTGAAVDDSAPLSDRVKVTTTTDHVGFSSDAPPRPEPGDTTPEDPSGPGPVADGPAPSNGTAQALDLSDKPELSQPQQLPVAATEASLASSPPPPATAPAPAPTSEQPEAETKSAEYKAKAEEDKLKERQHTLALWNELKVVSISRAVTGVYGIVLLVLQTHIMLNLIGRYSYLASVVALGKAVPTDGEGVEDEALQAAFDVAQQSVSSESGDQVGIDAHTERLYLTFSWWLLHRGWPLLADRVRAAVESTFDQVSILTPVSWHEFDRMLRSVRRKVEYDVLPPREQEAFAAASSGDASSLFANSSWVGDDLQSSALSEVSGTTRGSRRLLAKRKTFLDVLFPATPNDDEEVLVSGAGYSEHEAKRLMDQDGALWSLLNESKDLVESPDFRLVQRMCLNTAFNVLRSGMRGSFGLPPLNPDGSEPGLGPLLPGASRFHELSAEEESMLFTSGAGRRVKLAQLFPSLAKLSKVAYYGSPNQYVDAVVSVKELRAFSAVIYSSWPKDLA